MVLEFRNSTWKLRKTCRLIISLLKDPEMYRNGKKCKKRAQKFEKNPKKWLKIGGGNPLWPPILLDRVWPWWLAVVAGEEKNRGGFLKKIGGIFFKKNRGDFFKKN